MAKEKGTRVKLFVRPLGGSPPGTYYEVLGQRDTMIDLSRGQIDSSDKSTEGWATSLSGLKNGTVTCSGIPVWPDTTGLKVIQDAFDEEDDSFVEAYVAENIAGKGYYGTFAVLSCQISGSHTDVTQYSISLSPTEALTPVTTATISTTLHTAEVP